MKDYLKTHSLSTVAALLVLAVFAVGILCSLIFGASAYSSLTRRAETAFQSRTAAQYIANRVRQAPSPDAVAVEQFSGVPALVISQQIGEERYVTRIYCYEGWLMELFSDAVGEFAPEDGEKIFPAAAMALHEEQDLVSVTLTDAQGNEQTILLSVRGEEGSL